MSKSEGTPYTYDTVRMTHELTQTPVVETQTLGRLSVEEAAMIIDGKQEALNLGGSILRSFVLLYGSTKVHHRPLWS